MMPEGEAGKSRRAKFRTAAELGGALPFHEEIHKGK